MAKKPGAPPASPGLIRLPPKKGERMNNAGKKPARESDFAMSSR